MITDNGKVDFNLVQLESKNGRFLFEHPRNRKLVYEVSHDQFRVLFVKMAVDKANGRELPKRSNSFDFLLSQLEMNSDLFQAMLYPNEEWTI